MVYGLKENLKNGQRVITALRPEGFNLVDVTIFHFDKNFNLDEKIFSKNVNASPINGD